MCPADVLTRQMGFDGESLSSINFNYQIKRGYILTYVCIHAFYGAFFVFYTAQNTAYAKEENLFSEFSEPLLDQPTQIVPL